MWIVVIKDYYNDCGVGGFETAIGPFQSYEEADLRAKNINDLRHYATLAEAVELEEKYFGEK